MADAVKSRVAPDPGTGVAIVALAAIYTATAHVGFSFAVVAKQVTLVWPPSGIALAALLIYGRRLWPGVALGAFVANATASTPVPVSLLIAAGNALGASLGAWLLERVGFDRGLARLRDALALIGLAAAVSPMVAAVVGASALVLNDVESAEAFPVLLRDWWIGDGVGILTVAPVLLAWSRGRYREGPARATLEWMALAGATLATALFAFAHDAATPVRYPLHYLVFPFVAWAAARFRAPGASSVVLVVSAVAVASTRTGLGPFGARAEEALLLLQLFITVIAVTGLLLGAAIDERNTAHDALTVAEAHHRLALAAAHIGSWEWNLETNQVSWSESLEIHGVPPKSFDGTFQSFEELIHPDDRARVLAALRLALETRGEFESEFRNVQPNGTVRWLLGRGCVLTNEAGKPERLIGVGMDVTERRRMEEELRQQAQDLLEHDRRKDQFMARLAHELRNPLAPIAAAVRLLGEKNDNPAAVERLRGILERQISHLLRLVDDLLDVSRITAGKVKLTFERVELQRVLRSAIEMCTPLFEGRGVELVCELPEESIWVEADAVRLAQIVQNLLSNAARHGAGGGHVWLSAAQGPRGVVVRVRDDGAGMTPEVLRRVFEPFAQGPGTGNHLGLGIGLTLARELALLHGGAVEATSAGPGQGSEFTLTLPASAQPTAASERLTNAAPAAQRSTLATRRSVLVVDDNVDAAEMLAALVERRGHAVSVAYDGARAIEHARASLPDVMLLDIEMPTMSGYDVARVVRSDPKLRGMRLIAVSGHLQRSDSEGAARAGFDLHMVKPVDPEALYAALEGAS